MHRDNAAFNHVKRGGFGRPFFMAGIAASLMLFGVVTAFGIAPGTVVFEGERLDVVNQVATPGLTLLAPETDLHAREIQIRRGDTVAGLLSEIGVLDGAARHFLHTNRETDVLFRQLAPGKTIFAHVTSDGTLHTLRFPLNGDQGLALDIRREADGFAAEVHTQVYATQTKLQSAVIRNSLFGAADEAGIPDAVAIRLADIFGGDIDFHRDLRQGDRFSVVYEAAFDSGGSARSFKILAAEFINDGRTLHAFWHQDADGRGGYYAADGSSLKKAFLRSPIEFSRISSGFSSARFHPVLGRMRAHRGIDYAAPTGTRVRTTGDGVIEFVGSQGGYGNVIIVRHTGNITTLYAHLSGFAQGIRRGARISQGDVIGFVGATGMVTGPHLHYEFRVAGVHQDPLTVTLPSAPPLTQAQLPAFLADTRTRLDKIATVRDVRFVLLD